MDDKDAVKDVMGDLTPEAVELLRQVLAIEKQNLHLKSADVTDEVLAIVKGLIS